MRTITDWTHWRVDDDGETYAVGILGLDEGDERVILTVDSHQKAAAIAGLLSSLEAEIGAES